ncbi:MAG: GAF domain-containing protein [Terriglobales bacterium]
MTVPPSGARKLALDQESFQQLLAAAYTLQENKDVLQAGSSPENSASVFSEIAALRSQIIALVNAEPHVSPNNAEPKPAAEAAALVTDCLRRLTKADGATVSLIVDGYLRPTACSGMAAQVSGGSVASNSLVATERLRNGRAFQSANACSDIRLGPSLCVELQIGSLLAFPIERLTEIAGIVEVRWTKPGAFSDGDERICQLMADLMSEVLEGEEGRVNVQVGGPVQVTAPRQPVGETATPVKNSETHDRELSSGPAIGDAHVSASDHTCRVCGEPLNGDLHFCGNCGMLSSSLDKGMQGKWASMWFMQQAQKTVEITEGRGERLWPIHAENPRNAHTAGTASQTENPSDDIGTNETTRTLPESKHSPRGVFAVLKSRFRARAMGE